MSLEGIKNIFISHIHEDDHRLPALKEILAKHGCEVRDSSIDSSKPNNATSPEYIKHQILAPRIQWAGVMAVLISPDTKDSEYVTWEIEYALRQGKRIVGIWDHGESGCEIPEALDEFANAVVPWRGERMVEAILGGLDGSFNPDGTPCPPRAINRHNCPS